MIGRPDSFATQNRRSKPVFAVPSTGCAHGLPEGDVTGTSRHVTFGAMADDDRPGDDAEGFHALPLPPALAGLIMRTQRAEEERQAQLDMRLADVRARVWALFDRLDPDELVTLRYLLHAGRRSRDHFDGEISSLLRTKHGRDPDSGKSPEEKLDALAQQLRQESNRGTESGTQSERDD